MTYPITNDSGKLFCMAEKSEDGKNVILRSKNCEISLSDLQLRAMMPQKYSPRNKRMKGKEQGLRAG